MRHEGAFRDHILSTNVQIGVLIVPVSDVSAYGLTTRASEYPRAKPEALEIWPLKAAGGSLM